MRLQVAYVSAFCLILMSGAAVFGQEQAASASSTTNVPRLVSFSGTLKDGVGKPVSGPVSATFSMFAQQEGGTALWSETQTVNADAEGKYTAFLGATNPNGLPLELFTTGAARWLAVEPGVPAAVELSRVLLVGVPYALKAADADTLGGKPASAFLTAPAQTPQASAPATPEITAIPSITPAITPTGNGATDYVPLWTSSTNLGNSILFQGAGFLSIGGGLQFPALAAATTLIGSPSQPLDLFASAFNSSTNAAALQHFRWQAEPAANNTTTPSGKVDLLYASGAGTPAETGLSINGAGVITFALGQTFPSVTGNEAVSGNLSASQLFSTVEQGTAPLKVNSSTQVANLNATYLDGYSAGYFATLGSNNFSGTETINGYLNVSGFINDALFLQANVTDPARGYTSSNVIGGYLQHGKILTGGNHVTNQATGATIAGGGLAGYLNIVSDDFGTVSGGLANTAGAGNGNGQLATVGGGFGNTASGLDSTVSGGEFNTAAGTASFAGGNRANANDYGSFVWCQQLGDQCNSNGTNSFTVSVDGPVYFYDGQYGQGCYLSASSGSWACSSNRNLKNNIRSVDSRSILQRVAEMPISQWSMKADTAGNNHIGPMAQDFYAAFGLGESDKYIAQGDAQGVALASIQGLYQELKEKDEKIERLSLELHALEALVRKEKP